MSPTSKVRKDIFGAPSAANVGTAGGGGAGGSEGDGGGMEVAGKEAYGMVSSRNCDKCTT